MTTSADENVGVSIQEHASHLMAVADAVHESHHQRKEKLDVLMNETTFGSEYHGDLDESMVSLTTADIEQDSSSTTNSKANVTSPPVAEDINDSSESKNVPSATADAKDKAGDKKKSRFQTVSELKQQVLDCNRALLTMQENADLKYRKLELLVVNLKSNLETVKADLECANMDKQKLEAEKQFLEGSLQKAMGERQQADWVPGDTLKTPGSSNKVDVSLDKVTRERDDAMAEKKLMKEVMADCAQCSQKLIDSKKKQVHSGANHIPRTGASLWSTLNVAIRGLTAEADATAPTSPDIRMRPVSAELRQPPKEMFLFKEQSNQIKLDLEADIVALEKKMQDDVEALKSEWSKPSPTSIVRGRRKHRNDGKKHRDRSRKEGSSNRSSSIGGVGSLDSFFASAAQGLSLESEEMDEERSLFSMTRSVATAPVGQRRSKKNDHSRKKVSSSSSETDFRASYMSSGKSTSFRQSFRASLLGLGDEVSISSAPIRYNESFGAQDDHFEHLQREVADWGGLARRTATNDTER